MARVGTGPLADLMILRSRRACKPKPDVVEHSTSPASVRHSVVEEGQQRKATGRRGKNISPRIRATITPRPMASVSKLVSGA